MAELFSSTQSVKVDIKDHFDVSEAEALFERLDAISAINASKDSVFLSKSWLLSWLKVISKPVSLAVFYQDESHESGFIKIDFDKTNKPIGFALLGKQSAWYGDTYYLNQSGNPQDDQMWIEHNDVVCAEHHKAPCRAALLLKLQQLPRFHRIVISMTTSSDWPTEGLFTWSKDQSAVAYVDLHKLNEQAQAYEATLSKNTKSAVRRAAKYIENKHGNITMQRHTNNLASMLTSDIAPLHIQQWASTEHGSGFSNPVFAEFLQLLCCDDNDDCKCEVLTFSAGELVLGHLFNIISDNAVYFYLSAINYADSDNKYKPGMLIHRLAIEHYGERNMSKYDFLAGQARYKESLSTHSYPMYTIHLAKNTWTHRLLYQLNTFINTIRSRGSLPS